MSLRLIPVSLAEAKAFIEVFHRHLGPPRGHKFSLGAADQAGVLVAVAVVGRPVARGLDDGRTLEVTRLATDGTPNACSMLYAACRRATRALAYERLVTYTRAEEPGPSLRAAGWHSNSGIAAARRLAPAPPRRRPRARQDPVASTVSAARSLPRWLPSRCRGSGRAAAGAARQSRHAGGLSAPRRRRRFPPPAVELPTAVPASVLSRR